MRRASKVLKYSNTVISSLLRFRPCPERALDPSSCPMTMPMVDMSPVPTKTVAYLRVSTEEQARFGLSLESQRSRMQGYAIAYNLEIIEWVVDEGVSASKPTVKRPGFTRALQLLKEDKADAMLVADLDRFSRLTKEALEVIDLYFSEKGLNKTLMSLNEHIDTSTPDGRFMLTVKFALAQRESETTGQRVKKAHVVHVARRAESEGAESSAIAESPAKGRWGGRFMEEVVPPETIALIKDMNEREKMSVRRITERLNELGIAPGSLSRSGRWSKSAVGRVLGVEVQD